MKNRCFAAIAILAVAVVVVMPDARAEDIEGYVRLPAQYPEPGLSFGTPDALPLPKTVLYSASPDELVTDIAFPALTAHQRGVFLNPMGTKLYLSLAHRESDCDAFCERLDRTLHAVAATRAA